LLQRHRPRLFAAALRLLGYTADAEDAVQETCLLAMRFVGTVRDPESVGAWLHSILRRACVQHRRRGREGQLTDSFPDIADESASVEDRIEQLELRDWIRSSLEHLPEPLRVTAMLRYFGSYGSYGEVAATLGVPVGTVRSRLSQAKLKLADILLATAGLIDDESRAKSREREELWTESIRNVFRRGESTPFVSHFVPDLIVGWSHGRPVRGREHLSREIEGDIEANVRLEPTRVISTDGIAVVEGRLINPPETPNRCPPGIAFVIFGGDGKASRIRLHLSARVPIPQEV
jgi:RNA polymerase sigma-70 factor (ECF subfamily)